MGTITDVYRELAEYFAEKFGGESRDHWTQALRVLDCLYEGDRIYPDPQQE